MSRELILVLGGARSGKSRYAEELVRRLGERVLYVATAQPGDDEMAARIAIHRGSRPPGWSTLEAPLDVGAAVRSALEANPTDVVLLDCLTFLVTNCILQELPGSPSDEELDSIDETAAQESIAAELDGLLEAYRACGIPWIVVSNEVGMGLVPPYHLGRVFRDLQGWANQRLAAEADRVYLMVAGLPLDLKALSQTPGG
jgi:adenosylcobinamide kinase/adenosylcobinamide-phosphate guanylyltransferase